MDTPSHADSVSAEYSRVFAEKARDRATIHTLVLVIKLEIRRHRNAHRYTLAADLAMTLSRMELD